MTDDVLFKDVNNKQGTESTLNRIDSLMFILYVLKMRIDLIVSENGNTYIRALHESTWVYDCVIADLDMIL